MYRRLGITISLFSLTCFLHAASPDISNLDRCIYEVQAASVNPPSFLTFDAYVNNYIKLLTDLQNSASSLPHVYQEVAAKPLINYLKNLGEARYIKIFNGEATDDLSSILQQIIPDAALAILGHEKRSALRVNAFEEIVSDLYDGFLSNENRVSKQTGIPIDPPTYGSIPPLVKFGNQDDGPYTWPADATSQILGMGCAIVSLPPSQIKGGLLAWSTLGHETAGHDVTHADEGLLDELAQKVHTAVLNQFKSLALADYWANCVDESTADICGYLNMGPSLGISLIGYFRALGDGKLRTIGWSDDPHPIDLLRGYLAASTVKHLNFKDATTWNQVIINETNKDKDTLYLIDSFGRRQRFPVSFDVAVASTDVVAQTIMKSKLDSLQGHSLQELEDWKDHDQMITDQVATLLKTDGDLPSDLKGPNFYAAYIVAGATQAALQKGYKIFSIFSNMLRFLSQMHEENPTWSKTPTEQSIALIENRWKGFETPVKKHVVRHDIPEKKELALY